jgi:predicted dehydrogenase
VYLVSFASFVLGPPSSILASGYFTETGVDAQVSATLRGPGDRQAHLFTTLGARTPTTAFLSGTEGTLAVDGPFYMPGRLTLKPHGAGGTGAAGAPATAAKADFALDAPVDALCFEAAEAARIINGGGTESPLLPVAESVRIMHTLDEIGLRIRPGQ